MRATHALPIAAVLALAPAAATAAPATPNDELSIGGFERALRSTSSDAVAPDGLGGGTLTYARALPLSLVPDLTVWATASMTWGTAEGTLLQTMQTTVDTFGLGLGGRAAYALHPRLAVSGRLELGSTHTALTIDAPATTMGGVLSDAGWAATTTVAAGLDLRAIAHPRFALGFRLELGYVAASAPSLAPRGERDEDVITLPVAQASIGELDLAGKFISFLVVSAF